MAQKAKLKFDWETFLTSPERMVIHCTTVAETKKCLELLVKHGFYWKHSAIYYFKDCYGNPCFSNQQGYSSINYYNRHGTQIFKFSSYDFEERTENDT